MPKIDILTARGNFPVRRTDTTVSVARGDFGGDLMQATEKLSRVVNILNEQRDDNALLIAKGEYVGQLRGLHNELIMSEKDLATFRNDPEAYVKRFGEREIEIRNNILNSSPSKAVSETFDAFASANLPSIMADAANHGLKLYAEERIAQLDKAQSMYTFVAARAMTVEQRSEFIENFHDAINRAERRAFITPKEATRRRQDFDALAQTHHMRAIGLANPELLAEMDEAGMFDKVPDAPRLAIINHTMSVRDRAIQRAERAAEIALKNWREGIDRSFILNPENQTLEFLERHQDAFTGERLQVLRKMIDKDQDAGDPAVENAFAPNVYDTRVDPQQVFDSLVKLRSRGLIGKQSFDRWAPHVEANIKAARSERRSEIHRTEDKAEAARLRDETRSRELITNRFDQAMQNLNLAFKTTGGLSLNFDGVATEILLQARRRLQEEAYHLGGPEPDALKVGDRIILEYIPYVQSRATTRINVLRKDVGVKSMNELKLLRPRIGDVEYYKRLKMLDEIDAIQTRQEELLNMQLAAEAAAAAAAKKGK